MKRKAKHRAPYYVPRVVKYELAYLRNRYYVVVRPTIRKLLKQINFKK